MNQFRKSLDLSSSITSYFGFFQEHRRVLEKAYHDTRSPLAIAEECLLQREKRQGIDQVHDDVERSLSKVLANCSLLKNSSTSNCPRKDS